MTSKSLALGIAKMLKRRDPVLGLLLAALLGCTEAVPGIVIVTTPDAPTLDALVGSRVTIEGVASLDKQGEVIITSGVDILVDLPNSISDDWPDDFRRVRVTGVLERDEYSLASGFLFRLRSSHWTDFISEQLATGKNVFILVYADLDSASSAESRSLDFSRLAKVAGNDDFITMLYRYDDQHRYWIRSLNEEAFHLNKPLVLHYVPGEKEPSILDASTLEPFQ